MNQDAELLEPVAVVGMSCRFTAGLDSVDKLWAFVAEGGSAVGEMPDKRWEPYASGSPQATSILRNTTRLGSFMSDIEGFDAEFFGISPREAEYLDPQQRILLELAWEALEHAGIAPLSLSGSECGVFVSANSNDYGRRLLEDIPRTGAYAVNGTTYYGIANRISYFLDLRGPSMAVDTACAGSLTAIHLACQSLRAGEIPVAVVGGVNVMASPALFVALDAAGATSPDGRSKAFDAAADGYGRGEGAAVVVLKRLAEARAEGDRVLALIRGSGVFQDGRSDGMMAPNAKAQEYMLRQIYRRARIDPATVSYVEAHGTGTPVGDREEIQALARVFGAGRPGDAPCLIGSVKPNIGHIEAGSGIAGVIKAVLALQRQQIPPSIHTELNPGFDWPHSGLRLADGLSAWPAAGTPRRAGVSSYGVGGTIAHLILEEFPAAAAAMATDAAEAPAPPQRPAVFPVSAVSDAGLRALAGAVADWVASNPGTPLASIGHTLARRRSHLVQRGAVVARSATELRQRLQALAAGQQVPGVARARTCRGHEAGVVWVFSGHGAHWPGMGRQLLREEPAFAATVDSLEDIYREQMGWTPREAIEGGGPWTSSQAQALTFAMQVGLSAVWRRHGIMPGAVIGHSVGEIAASVAAGCNLEEAARFACRRALALRRLEGLGGMAMVGLSFQDTQRRLGGRPDVVAAISASLRSTVVSGDLDAVGELAEQWSREGIEIRRVNTDIAFHSPHIDAVVGEVAAAASDMRQQPPQVRLYSTALADPRSCAPRDSGYWAANVRQPVRFAAAVEAAVQDGHRLFLEISSHPVVTHSITELLDQLGEPDAVAVPSMRRNTPEAEALAGSLAELHCHGAAIDWLQEHPGGDLVDLPAMAWQHRPYWIFPADPAQSSTGAGHDPQRHSLLGGRTTISGAPGGQVWQTFLDLTCRPYPQSHEVVGVEITPAASIINTFMLAAARDGTTPTLSNVVLRTPLAVTPPRVVQVILAENSLHLASRIGDGNGMADDDEHAWIIHSTATVEPGRVLGGGRIDAEAVRARCDDEWPWKRVDGLFRSKGVGGYAFPWALGELRANGKEQLATLTLTPLPAQHATSWAHVIDGALTISAVLVTPQDADRLWMSSRMASVVFHGEPPARITVHTVRSAQSPLDTVDVRVADEQGTVVCEVGGLRFAALQDQLAGPVAAPRDLVHEVVWRPLAFGAAGRGQSPVSRAVLVGGDAVAAALAAQLEATGVRCTSVGSPEDLRQVSLPADSVVLVTPSPGSPDERAEAAAERCAWTLIRTAQLLSEMYLTAAKDAALPKVWCLTQAVRDARRESALAHAPLWGISRIVAGEHPELWGGLVDVADMDAETGRRLLPIFRQAAGTEDVISVTGTDLAVARLSKVQRSPDGAPLQCTPTGTYLITGGLGALGLLVARHLVDRGARRLLLASRRGLPPRAEWSKVRDSRTRAQIEEVLGLEALGVTVHVLALDVTDPDQVAAALAPSSHGLPPVRGIVHAAGVVCDAMLEKVDRSGLGVVLGPKAAGAMVLHRLFPPGSLDFFVLFSSCGQFARLTGQISYAAANSFLDTLAAHRHAAGHTETTSLAWTAWQGAGMSETIAGTMLEANARGLGAVSPAEALRAWSFAERYNNPYQAILRFLPLPPTAPLPPMFRELTAAQAGLGDEGQAGFTADWDGLPAAELRDLVTADVREQVATELYMPTEDIEVRRPLVEFGVDSPLTVALRVRLNRRYGVDLPPTILWNNPTVARLAEHLIDNLSGRPDADAVGAPASALSGIRKEQLNEFRRVAVRCDCRRPGSAHRHGGDETGAGIPVTSGLV